MQHLFLTSIDITGFLKYIGKPAEELKVAYTPTAAEPYENKWFVDEDRKRLKEVGITFSEFNLTNIDDQHAFDQLEEILEGVDVIIVGGGNTFYLLSETIRTNFGHWVKKLVAKGTWYVGASAGAALAGVTIEPIKYMDNPEKAPFLKAYSGLGLVDFFILPHLGQVRYGEAFEKAQKDCHERNIQCIAITDEQSILVEGDSRKIVISSSLK